MPVSDMASFLRRETADCHADLEARLQLLSPPLTAARFTRLIQRMYGFHAPWEEALASHGQFVAHVRRRSRLPSIARDLIALGARPNDIPRIKQCAGATDLVRCKDAALGSCYVIEGSTLGGQVIARSLAEEKWLPIGGLATFNPYGADTGRMWRAFKVWLDGSARDADPVAVAAGARRTFILLADWLAE